MDCATKVCKTFQDLNVLATRMNRLYYFIYEGRISKVPAAKIKQWLRNWEDVQECLVTYHPDNNIVFDGINILEKVFEFFRASVKKRVRQQTMDKFLLGPSPKRARVSEQQPSTSSALDPSARSVFPDRDSQLQPSPSGIVSARRPPRSESESDSDSEEPGQSDIARQPPRKALVGVSDSDSDPDDSGIMEGDSPSKQH
ncbi:hypothetical protein GWK47_016053 [Chionoecetes opilio]|uniref:Uncharacterized protein n=1 Tax=Chionoecetes opilio TaxID=41210 RepID=A0A8J4Y267_CHIOP|nr:hypothetical protein GWK47_016053 [Chionoecetes opilio]